MALSSKSKAWNDPQTWTDLANAIQTGTGSVGRMKNLETIKRIKNMINTVPTDQRFDDLVASIMPDKAVYSAHRTVLPASRSLDTAYWLLTRLRVYLWPNQDTPNNTYLAVTFRDKAYGCSCTLQGRTHRKRQFTWGYGKALCNQLPVAICRAVLDYVWQANQLANLGKEPEELQTQAASFDAGPFDA